MSSLLLRMLLPLTLLAATGVPIDPACASAPNGTANCGRGEVREIAKNIKEIPARAASHAERQARPEAL